MKSALRKNTMMEILKTKSRFLSIFFIVAIGIAFFAGVKNTAPDMRLSADNYYKKSELAHFRLISTMGFSENDIETLENTEGLEVYPGYFADVIIDSGEQDEIARVMTLPEYGKNGNVNMLELQEGRFPEKPDECIVDSGALSSRRSVGDRIVMVSGGDEDLSKTLSVTEYTVVGTFVSPAYIDKSARGNTTLGNGNISTLVYVNEENFLTEVYTEIYIRAEGLSSLAAYSKAYDDENDFVKKQLELIGDNREIERYNEILEQANGEIAKAEKELEDAKKEANEKLDEAKSELDKAKKDLENAEKSLADAKKELEDGRRKLDDSRKELDSGWSQLRDGEKELEEKINQAQKEINEKKKLLSEAEEKYREGVKEYNKGLDEYNKGLAQYNEGVAQYEKGLIYYSLILKYHNGEIDIFQLAAALGFILPQQQDGGAYVPAAAMPDIPSEILEFIANLPSKEETEAQLAALEETGKMLEATALKLDQAKKELADADKKLRESEIQLDEGNRQLSEAEQTVAAEKEKGEAKLKENREALEEGEKQYAQGLEDFRRGEVEYADGMNKYTEGIEKYNDGLSKYETSVAEAEKEIADGEQKLRDAKRELKDIENPVWYIFDRSGNGGYSEYGENAERINNIASVFPVFFILVAALVCLTTMTRMVEEQRSQIGTLKALGYTNRQIISKFMLYALSATLLGALAGAVFGQKLFPFAIISAYGMLYDISGMSIPTDWLLTFVCMAVSAAAVALTVYFSCKGELSEQPAQLMRPKAPRAGKKILLDRLPIWKKVGFNGKVTARNLFRYKRRMLMTVVGIAGCTALTLVGFGLENSISDIINKQYGELNSYDGFLAYDSVDEGDTEKILSVIDENGYKSIKYLQKQITVRTDKGTCNAYLVVPENKNEFLNYFTFRSRTDHTPYEFEEDRVLIDEKLSLLLGVEAGEEAEIYQDETDIRSVSVSACVENYPNHYVYMSRALYERLFGEAPDFNIIAFGSRETPATEKEQDLFAESLLGTNAVLSVNFKDDLIITMSTMLNALNSVVAILIISAGALAFVVLYNLTNINITERIREIATLKVMGFYDGEVDSYIFRENLILTLMGIAAGLFGGYFLAQFIIQTAEIDLVMFGREIKPLSYVYSAAITLVFSIVVAIYMHGHLKKVDMIEALKSVE